jgi:hypothetical protein
VTKYVNELYASVFCRTYGLPVIGLRYFNVFGARQDPAGPYAAVIPRWVKALLAGEPVKIFGDGETSRDFCYVKNVVQMNLLAAIGESLRSRRSGLQRRRESAHFAQPPLQGALRVAGRRGDPGVPGLSAGRRAAFAGGHLESTATAGLCTDP